MTNGCISRFLTTSGTHVAYTATSLSRPPPCALLVFLPGLNSTFTDSKKATLMCQLAHRHNCDFLAFDHLAHGATGGRWSDVTMARWVDDAAELLASKRQDAAQPMVLVGASMGLWVAALLAEKLPDAVKGIVGIGGSVNFHHRWLKDATDKGYDNEVKWAMEQGRRMAIQRETEGGLGGKSLWRPPQMQKDLRPNFVRPSRYSSEPYAIPFPFLASLFRAQLSLPLSLSCPVGLVHGHVDADVPWQEALQILSEDAPDGCLTLVSGEGHRLSGESGLAAIETTVEWVLNRMHADSKRNPTKTSAGSPLRDSET
ncbi:hypothetical protein PHYBOEH_003356 [Phytophthora boehmeriae]|uniref:Serine aminopeptidase S33 domain-containing protein n=1 Tax=Phytophthora boehmeriae TaxID=109152 RepID=A0A8T1WP31_9STRA|nr:hypothetical protein PHYBOEH_003356 [Phytophthora boehmeriae]